MAATRSRDGGRFDTKPSDQAPSAAPTGRRSRDEGIRASEIAAERCQSTDRMRFRVELSLDRGIARQAPRRCRERDRKVRVRDGGSRQPSSGRMTAQERIVDGARRRARDELAVLAREIRDARLSAGRRQLDVARAAGISDSELSRLELGQTVDMSYEVAAAVGALVGLRVVLRAYPGDRVLFDEAQVRLLRALRERLGPEWKWRFEVPVASGDQRAWDMVGRHALTGLVIVGRGRDPDPRPAGAPPTYRPEARRLGRPPHGLAGQRHAHQSCGDDRRARRARSRIPGTDAASVAAPQCWS